MKTKLWVAATSLLGLFFLGLIVSRGVLFLQQPQPEARGFGVAFLVLAAIGAFVLVREVIFGLSCQRLSKVLVQEQDLPLDDLPKRPSGRIEREAADAAFEAEKERTERNPQDWRSWFRLSLAYDASGDRRRARAAARRAIALERGKNTSETPETR